MSVELSPLDISSDPVPELQLVASAAVHKARQQAAAIEAKKAYAVWAYKPNRLPPRRRMSHLAILGLAFVLTPPLTLIIVAAHMAIRAILAGVKP